MALALLRTDRLMAAATIDACGRLSLDVKVAPGTETTWDGIRSLAEDLVAQIETQLAGLRYLATPVGRHVTICQLAADWSPGRVLWRTRSRPGETVRVVCPRLRNRAEVVGALELELLATLIAGGPLVEMDRLDLVFVDAHSQRGC